MAINLINTSNTKHLNKFELDSKGKYDARTMADDGLLDVLEMMAKARKAIQYFTAYTKEIESDVRGKLPDSQTITVLGSEFSLGSTGDRIDYESDPVYAAIKAKLAERTALLKMAKNAKETIYDGDASEVPRLPLKTASREVLKIKV